MSVTFRELRKLLDSLPEGVLDPEAIVVTDSNPFEVFGRVESVTRGEEPSALGEIPDWVWNLKEGDNWPYVLEAGG